MQIKNISTGDRGIRTTDGTLVMLAPNEVVDLDVSDAEMDDAADWFEEFDGDDADDLSKLSVVKLKAIAETESIDLGDATKKADIISAIELAREG